MLFQGTSSHPERSMFFSRIFLHSSENKLIRSNYHIGIHALWQSLSGVSPQEATAQRQTSSKRHAEEESLCEPFLLGGSLPWCFTAPEFMLCSQGTKMVWTDEEDARNGRETRKKWCSRDHGLSSDLRTARPCLGQRFTPDAGAQLFSCPDFYGNTGSTHRGGHSSQRHPCFYSFDNFSHSTQGKEKGCKAKPIRTCHFPRGRSLLWFS